MNDPTALRSHFEFTQLSEGDTLQGYCLNSVQEAVLRNEIAQIAHQLIAMKIDLKAPEVFALEQSYLQGQMEILVTIVNRSLETQQLLATLAQQQR